MFSFDNVGQHYSIIGPNGSLPMTTPLTKELAKELVTALNTSVRGKQRTCEDCAGMGTIEEVMCGLCEEGIQHSHCDDTNSLKRDCTTCLGSGSVMVIPWE